MAQAAFWGFVGGAALLLGAVVAVIATVPKRAVGIIMAFGAGVLISAVAFELTDEAFREEGRTRSPAASPPARWSTGERTEYFSGEAAARATRSPSPSALCSTGSPSRRRSG